MLYRVPIPEWLLFLLIHAAVPVTGIVAYIIFARVSTVAASPVPYYFCCSYSSSAGVASFSSRSPRFSGTGPAWRPSARCFCFLSVRSWWRRLRSRFGGLHGVPACPAEHYTRASPTMSFSPAHGSRCMSSTRLRPITERSNQAMQLTAPRSVFPLSVATTFHLQPCAASGAVADLVSR